MEWAKKSFPSVSIIASMERRKASARPMSGSFAISPNPLGDRNQAVSESSRLRSVIVPAGGASGRFITGSISRSRS